MALDRGGTAVTLLAKGPAAANARYVLLRSTGGAASAPILIASNPMGGALLSTGLMSLAGAAAATMSRILPVRMCGIDVDEPLRRFETGADDRTDSLASANRVGEAIGSITMRLLAAPDSFEATPSFDPPATEIDAARSQRLVMQNGMVRFRDRTGSGMRFFGAGRTYPSGGRLLFAAGAVVVEGLGTLKGLRGTLTIAGEISARSLITTTVSGRFDEMGPFEAAERLSPLLDGDEVRDATVMTFAGESAGGRDGDVVETLHAVRIENDLVTGGQPRTEFHVGAVAGTATGPLRFDPSDHRCAVPLFEARRVLTFVDAAGQPVATVAARQLEGTAFPDQQGDAPVSRVVAYGPLSSGGGTLDGAPGLLTFDSAVAADGSTTTIYTLWLADQKRLVAVPEAPNAEAAASASATEPTLRPAPFVESTAAMMRASDMGIVALADATLTRVAATRAWLAEKERRGDFAEHFDIVPDRAAIESFGFFDQAPSGATSEPVMGLVYEMVYDRLKGGCAEGVREQLRAFVLRYFLRAAGRYEQLYFRRRGNGEIAPFPAVDRSAIVDLRDIGERYDWVVFKLDVFPSDVPVAPFGARAPQLQVPLHVPAYLVAGPDFIVNSDVQRHGSVAEYGFGYGFIPYAGDAPGVLAHGPGHFRTALQTVRFMLMADGEIRAKTVLVVNRPDRIASIDLDPVAWGFQLADLLTFQMASQMMAPIRTLAERLPLRAQAVDPVSASIWLANAMTGGLAAKRFGISKEVVEKRMLLQQFKQHQDMLYRSLHVWRMVPDWTVDSELPDYCRRGTAC